MNGGAYAGGYAMLFVIPPAWTILAAADFNADGKADLLLSNKATGDNGVLILDGTAWSGVFAPVGMNGNGWILKTVGDINRDSRPDLIWQHPSDGYAYVQYMISSAFDFGTSS